MTLFRDRYRIESSRLPGWDYSSPGYYFVTVCTHDRKRILSEIIKGQVHLTPIGLIVNEEWLRSGHIRKNIELHEFVIMPHHLHGIIQIKYRTRTREKCTVDNVDFAVSPVETPCHDVSTGNGGNIKQPDEYHWKPGVLGAIVGQFKIQVSKRARHAGYSDFRWQPRFHDRVIRDAAELFRIQRYIQRNPEKWIGEKIYP